MSTYRTVATAATDAKGAYEFTGLWPKDRYHVEASAAGYSKVQGNQALGVAGTTSDFAELKLARTSLSVGGTVVGPDGKPLAGAELFSVDGPERFTAKSAPDGTFTLVGFSENGGFAFAKLAGYRLGMAAVIPGAIQKLRIPLQKSDATPTPLPAIPPSVRTEQGMTTMPSVRNDPDEIVAPMSPWLCTTVASARTCSSV